MMEAYLKHPESNKFIFSTHLYSEGLRNINCACRSSKKLQQLAKEQLTGQPRKESSSLTLLGRVTHFTVGFLLCLPLVNIMTYFALRMLGLISPKEEKKLDFTRLLPKELMHQIFSYLNEDALIQCLQVDKRWKEIANHPVKDIGLPKELEYHWPTSKKVCRIVHRALRTRSESVYTIETSRIPGAAGYGVFFHYKGKDGIVHHHETGVSHFSPTERPDKEFEKKLKSQGYEEIPLWRKTS